MSNDELRRKRAAVGDAGMPSRTWTQEVHEWGQRVLHASIRDGCIDEVLNFLGADDMQREQLARKDRTIRCVLGFAEHYVRQHSGRPSIAPGNVPARVEGRPVNADGFGGGRASGNQNSTSQQDNSAHLRSSDADVAQDTGHHAAASKDSVLGMQVWGAGIDAIPELSGRTGQWRELVEFLEREAGGGTKEAVTLLGLLRVYFDRELAWGGAIDLLQELAFRVGEKLYALVSKSELTPGRQREILSEGCKLLNAKSQFADHLRCQMLPEALAYPDPTRRIQTPTGQRREDRVTPRSYYIENASSSQVRLQALVRWAEQ